jgi:hypothetical protein
MALAVLIAGVIALTIPGLERQRLREVKFEVAVE